MQGDFSGSSEEGGIKHCLQLQDAAGLNPVAYLNGLAKAVTDMGGKIYESTRVRKPDRSVLETDAGNKVRPTGPQKYAVNKHQHGLHSLAVHS